MFNLLGVLNIDTTSNIAIIILNLWIVDSFWINFFKNTPPIAHKFVEIILDNRYINAMLNTCIKLSSCDITNLSNK